MRRPRRGTPSRQVTGEICVTDRFTVIGSYVERFFGRAALFAFEYRARKNACKKFERKGKNNFFMSEVRRLDVVHDDA